MKHFIFAAPIAVLAACSQSEVSKPTTASLPKSQIIMEAEIMRPTPRPALKPLIMRDDGNGGPLRADERKRDKDKDDNTDSGSGTDVGNPDGACEVDNAPGDWDRSKSKEERQAERRERQERRERNRANYKERHGHKFERTSQCATCD